VSPRWNRSVRLRIGVDAVRASAHAGWPRVATIARAERPVTSPARVATDPSAHAPEVDAALAELGARMPLQGARLEVQVASTLLHFDVVEGDFGAQTDRQLQGVASACLSEMLGDEAAGRAVRWHLQDDDRHLLIVALSDAWIELAQAAATAAGLRLASVRPAFVARWNESRKAMKPGPGVFVVCDPRDLAIAAVADGAIAAISVGDGVDLAIEPPAPAPRTLGVATAATGAVASSGFSPDRPGIATVDDRVDRFLSARGQDPETLASFVMVAPDGTPVAASPRWSVIASPEMRA